MSNRAYNRHQAARNLHQFLAARREYNALFNKATRFTPSDVRMCNMLKETMRETMAEYTSWRNARASK